MKRWYIIRLAISNTDSSICPCEIKFGQSYRLIISRNCAMCPCEGAILSKTFRKTFHNRISVTEWMIELDDIFDFMKKIGCNVIVSQESGSYDKGGREYPEITIISEYMFNMREEID